MLRKAINTFELLMWSMKSLILRITNGFMRRGETFLGGGEREREISKLTVPTSFIVFIRGFEDCTRCGRVCSLYLLVKTLI